MAGHPENVNLFSDKPSFSDFTKISTDISGSFFTQWLNTFEPNRVYKIMLKLKTDDGNQQIFDEDFEFKVKR